MTRTGPYNQAEKDEAAAHYEKEQQGVRDRTAKLRAERVARDAIGKETVKPNRVAGPKKLPK